MFLLSIVSKYLVLQRSKILHFIDTGKRKKLTPQLTFTCSNSTIETLEKGVKYSQS